MRGCVPAVKRPRQIPRFMSPIRWANGIVLPSRSICVCGRQPDPHHGGQNRLEPAKLGCAVLAGPQTSNFSTAYQEIFRVQGAGLAAYVRGDRRTCHDAATPIGKKHAQWAKPSSTGAKTLGGAVGKTVTIVNSCSPMHAPDFWERQDPLSRLAVAALAPLGWLYSASVAWKARNVVPYRAGVPVICVGNLTVGGTGKTPVAIAIARALIRAVGALSFYRAAMAGACTDR